MKHFYLTLIAVVAAVLAFPVNAFAQTAILYGYARNFTGTGLVTIDASDPSSATRINGNVTPTAGAIKDSTMYIVGFDDDFNTLFYQVDITTGQSKKISTVPESVGLPMDMGFNYNDDHMYFVTNSTVEGMSQLCIIDLTSGKSTTVKPNLGFFARAMTVAADGTIYYVTRDGVLFSYDLSGGKSTEIGATGITPRATFSSLGFDRKSNKLYWAVESDGSYVNKLYQLDLASGHATDLGVIGTANNGEGYWAVALDAPFVAAQAAAPLYVDSLTATPDQNGELTTDIGWINPDSTVNGMPLETIDSVVVTRGDIVVGKVTDAQPGKPSTFTDHVPDAGTYRYHVQAYNAAGASADRYVDVYVGHDLPGPAVLALADLYGSNQVANVLTWHAPATGSRGGYYEKYSLRYDVIRKNDMKKLAENTTDSTFIDRDIATLQRYEYIIVPKNDDGIGDSTETNFIVNGPAVAIDTVYTADFDTEADAMLWTPYDANGDGYTFEWHYYPMLKPQGKNLYVYQAHPSNYAADFLVSPPMEFTEGHEYDITVTAANSFAPYPEQFTVCTMGGNAPHGALVGATLTDPIVVNHPEELREYRFHLSKIADDGQGTANDKFTSFLAINCKSNPAMQMFLAGSFRIVDKTQQAIADGINVVKADTAAGERQLFTADGTLVAKGNVNLKAQKPGLYILRQGKMSRKIVVK